MHEDAPPTPPLAQRLDQTEARPYRPGEYVRRLAWALVQATLIRLSPPHLGKWRNFWFRRFGGHLDKPSTFKPSTRITHPWLLRVGEYSILADRVRVYNLGPITIGSHTVISQGAYLCAGTHDYTKAHMPLQRPQIHIGSGVWVCTEAFIGPGLTIGDNAVIGARAVVVHDVPPNVVVAGNPAKVIKPRTPRTAE